MPVTVLEYDRPAGGPLVPAHDGAAPSGARALHHEPRLGRDYGDLPARVRVDGQHIRAVAIGHGARLGGCSDRTAVPRRGGPDQPCGTETTRLRPERLARYIASSARLIMSEPDSTARLTVTPMLTVMWMTPTDVATGSVTAVRIF
jgi:hypothetical protein